MRVQFALFERFVHDVAQIVFKKGVHLPKIRRDVLSLSAIEAKKMGLQRRQVRASECHGRLRRPDVWKALVGLGSLNNALLTISSTNVAIVEED